MRSEACQHSGDPQRFHLYASFQHTDILYRAIHRERLHVKQELLSSSITDWAQYLMRWIHTPDFFYLAITAWWLETPWTAYYKNGSLDICHTQPSIYSRIFVVNHERATLCEWDIQTRIRVNFSLRMSGTSNWNPKKRRGENITCLPRHFSVTDRIFF